MSMDAGRRGLLSRSAFLLGCLSILGGCKTAGFREVYMSMDAAGRRRTKVFPTSFPTEDSGIFCQILYSTGRDDAELKIYVTTPSENTPVTPLNGDSILLSKGEGQLAIQLGILVETPEGKVQVDPTQPFEEGDYRLDFYIDNSKEDSISFFVVREPSAESPPE
ncbi:MAG: hypothetical protein RMJ98_09905 [Myxococcales bacterium]|nr:hypothetical protein [Polyangiaceae bacterium]MDW8249603.1 hypothetical protein [Myxococcales bacterium]